MTIIGVAFAGSATAFDHVYVCVHLIMQFEQSLTTIAIQPQTQAQELKTLVLNGFLVDFVGLNTAPKKKKTNKIHSATKFQN